MRSSAGSDRANSTRWRIAERIRAGYHQPRPTVYSAPRRFDLATIFVVTSAYAILFGGLSALDAFPIVSFVIGGFVTFVGIGQAVLFRGEKPRSASMLVGVVLHAIIWIGAWVAFPRMYPAALILFIAGYAVVGGVILGYCAGTLVGGVFLVADKLRGRFSVKSSLATPTDQPASDIG